MVIISEELGLVLGLPADEVFDRLRQARDQEGVVKRVIAFFIAEVYDRDLCAQTPYGTMENFALNQLDMDPRRCREYARVGRALLDLPVLDRAYSAGEVSWSKVITLTGSVIQRETQEAWTEFAKTNSFRDLRHEVQVCKPGDLPGEGGEHKLLHQLAKHIHFLDDPSEQTYQRLQTFLSNRKEQKLDESEFLMELLQVAAKALLPDEPKPERQEEDKPLPFERRNHDPIPDDVREAVLRRDRHQCSACGKKYDLHIHHIMGRSWGGDNSMANLTLVCIHCHTAIHLGYLITEGNPGDKSLRFLTNTGQPLHRTSGRAHAGRPR